MPQFYVCVTRRVEQSVFLIVRAKDSANAKAKVQARIDSGVIWEELTKNLDVEELDDSMTIEEVRMDVQVEMPETHQQNPDKRFLDLAKMVASWSKDPSTQTVAVIDDGHPWSRAAMGGTETLRFEVHCNQEDEGLISGAPGRPGTDSHGHTRVAAVWEVEKPLPTAVPRVGLEADESAMAGEGGGHD